MASERLWFICFWLFLAVSARQNSVASALTESPWQTKDHSPGKCAMFDVCGLRKDHDDLNCPANVDASLADAVAASKLPVLCPTLWESSGGKVCCSGKQVAKMESSLRMAEPFIIGCPSCHRNFKNFFCTLVCSPDQATFTNVTAVQAAYSNNVTSVKDAAFYLDQDFKNSFYNSCKDVIFPAANQRAMIYIGDGAQNSQDFLKFLGMVKDSKPVPIGSPFQMDFPVVKAAPQGIQLYNRTQLACWDSVFKCSCGDCPDAPSCQKPPPGPPSKHGLQGCAALGLQATRITCLDLGIWIPGCAFCILLVMLYLLGWLSTSMRRASMRRTSSHSQRVLEASVRHQNSAQRVLLGEVDLEADGFSDDDVDDRTDTIYGNRSREITVELPAVEAYLREVFRSLGHRCATHPLPVLLTAICVVAVCMLGLVFLHIETRPIKLWVGEDSKAAIDKTSFDDSFGPFYRIEQILVSTVPATNGSQPAILTSETLDLVFDIHDFIHNTTANFHSGSTSLADICHKPFGDVCAIESIAQYWQMDRSAYHRHYLSLDYCLSHWSTDCRSAFEAPIEPKLVLGGYPTDGTFKNYTHDSTTLLITLPVNASKELQRDARLWEEAFLETMVQKIVPLIESKGLQVSYSAERSIEDELNAESYSDAGTIALSYLAMFVYIAVAMAKVPQEFNCASAAVYSRAGLGFAGVCIVLCSVVGALGLCSLFGVWATLIIMEVIPFLVLAVGVDNMFILALLEARQPEGTPIVERMANTLAAAGPSIMMASLSEAVAFGMAATTPMPAVRNFALCAMIAVLLDFFLQITAFMAILTLDTARMESGRADCMPYIQLVDPQTSPVPLNFELDTALDEDEPLQARLRIKTSESPVQRLLRSIHNNFLSEPVCKLIVLLSFVVGAMVSLTAMQRVEVGLDQTVALPRDSYLQDYYRDIMKYARVGPPVMFVVEGMNVSASSSDISTVCASAGCQDDSLLNQIAAAARVPNQSYLASPAASWIDDYIAWVQPELSDCCRVHTNGSEWDFCSAPDVDPCHSSPKQCTDCRTCLSPKDLSNGRPVLADTLELLPEFLHSRPSAACAKGGLGVYNDQIAMDPNTDHITGLEDSGTVTASFRALSAPLSRQRDFVDALSATRSLEATAQKVINTAHQGKDGPIPQIYSYSVFHPFFEQYLTMREDSTWLLSGASLAVFVVTIVMTGSVWLAMIILLCLVSILVSMLGCMTVWDIQLNAVSLVNLAMSLGIGVEFLAHISHSFLIAAGTREARTQEALVDMGASVCSGIMLTKFVGVSVLYFSQTQIFEIYYFRMYMCLVILGSLHGLILLPVLLSLLGPGELPHRKREPEQSELTAPSVQPVTSRQPVFIRRHSSHSLVTRTDSRESS